MPQVPPSITQVRGLVQPQLRRQTVHFDPTHGPSGDFFYDCAAQAEMLLLYNSWIAQGAAASITLENDKATLEVKDSTQTYVIDSWEIVGNNEIRDLFSHPSVTSLIAAKGDNLGAVASALRTGLANNTPSEGPGGVGGLFDNMNTILFKYANTVVEDFYVQYGLGNTGYRNAQYVLRHRTNVSNRWDVNIADFGINQLYTPAQFLTEVSSSAFWIFPLPGRLQYKLGLIPAQPITGPTPPGYLWSWLKDASTETTAANNRVDIMTEYSLDLWFVKEYALYTGGGPF